MSDKDMSAFIAAFKTLVPADQTAVACIVFKLASQQKEISLLAKEVMSKLNDTL